MENEEHEKLRLYLEELVKQPVHPHRIASLTVNPLYHGSAKMCVRAGQAVGNLEPEAPVQRVLAIFESKSFLVVTPERGYFEGLPYFFTRTEVVAVEREPQA